MLPHDVSFLRFLHFHLFPSWLIVNFTKRQRPALSVFKEKELEGFSQAWGEDCTGTEVLKVNGKEQWGIRAHL